MDTLGRILILLARGLRAAWEGIVSGGGALLGGADAMLNPILAPIVAALNPIATAAGDAVYAALAWLPPWGSLTVLSVLFGLAALVVFRYTSNQRGIGRVRDRITANLLAISLFRDEIRVTLASQAKILLDLLWLQRYLLPPLLILLLPMLVLLAQIGLRHQWRPLQPGERTLLRVRMASVKAARLPAALEVVSAASPQASDASAGVVIETPGIAGGREIVWRLRAVSPGRHTLRLRVGDSTIDKEIVVGEGFTRVSAERAGGHWWPRLLHPAEPPLPRGEVTSVAVEYPGPTWPWVGRDVWVVYVLVVSLAGALLFQPWLRVRM